MFIKPHASTAPRRTRHGESGNILFLILIAVALFAFLSFVVAQSTRGTGGDGNRENTSMRASRVIQYATYAHQAMQRMKFRGVPPDQYCFDDDNWGHNDYYHSGCDNPRNQLFSNDPAGGNVPWARPPEEANDGSPWYFPANICIAGQGTSIAMNCDSDGTGESEDLIMVLPNMDYAVCMAINKHLGIPEYADRPPMAGPNMFAGGMPKFAGTFADGTVINSAGTDITVVRDRQQACVEGNGNPPANTFHYYQVLLAR